MKTILNLPMDFFRVITNGLFNLSTFISKQIRIFFDAFKKPMATSVLSQKGLIFAVVVGLFVAILAMGVQPFGLVDFSSSYKTFFLLGFGLIAFVGMLISKFILPLLLKNYYDEQSWTVGRQVVHVLFTTLIISTLSIIYSNFFKIQQFDFFDVFTILLIGILPIIVLTISQQKVYQNKFQASAQNINHSLKTIKLPESKQLFPMLVFGKNKENQLSILPNQLIYAKISANSSVFYYQNLMGVEKKTIDISLEDVEKEFKAHPQFIKLHSHFIVNLHGIKKIEGNARGYQLHLARVKQDFYISRKFQKIIEKI
jgi:hypothetical protein